MDRGKEGNGGKIKGERKEMNRGMDGGKRRKIRKQGKDGKKKGKEIRMDRWKGGMAESK